MESITRSLSEGLGTVVGALPGEARQQIQQQQHQNQQRADSPESSFARADPGAADRSEARRLRREQ